MVTGKSVLSHDEKLQTTIESLMADLPRPAFIAAMMEILDERNDLREDVAAARERLGRATEFTFEEIDVVIAARFNKRAEGAGMHWVIHRVKDPKRFLNREGRWETQEEKAYSSSAFIERTRMFLDEAFAIVEKLLPPSRPE